MHCFTISICETVSQFNDNLKTNLIKGRGPNKLLEQLKSFFLKRKEGTLKSAAISGKNRK